MHVLRTECLVTIPCKLAFFPAVERNLPISFLPRGLRMYHPSSSGFLVKRRSKMRNLACSFPICDAILTGQRSVPVACAVG